MTATQEEKRNEKARIHYWKKKTAHEAMETGREDVGQKTDKYMFFKTHGLSASAQLRLFIPHAWPGLLFPHGCPGCGKAEGGHPVPRRAKV